ncbi:hypothetical protein [Spiroplasma melliferum]|uniref:Uncharacterized protein n=2 Tax=Spiroplasma melliferum TaxID=2134 RepID=A0AAI9X1F8_SPIME|nr:hypothetical protein [Spiroplasma melliferum]ELL44591.1 hypothetical protein SMIPMB4A_v3c4800 [Spiroplasma melliferum IPMB4A]KAI93053.1 hypothetical protein SPM_003555 [Spiroplasma melliferum KC3]QCO24035.1 hypothetical protein SRED_002515 [Spiroplasma melliferum]
MEITAEIKRALKKTYKSIKKSINKFFKKLGFNKIETNKISNKISNDVNELINTCINSKYFEQIDLLYQTPSFWTNSENKKNVNESVAPTLACSQETPIYENVPFVNKDQGNKYKELLNDANSILLHKKEDPVNKPVGQIEVEVTDDIGMEK